MELKQLDRKVVYKGRIIDLFVDEIEYPSGARGIREVAHHPGGAVTVPVFEDGTVMLVRQYRYPLDGYTVELPAGKLDPGEDPAVAAVRELEEETGWHAGHLRKLAAIYTTPGFCDEQLHIYLAGVLTESPAGHRREEGEATMSLLRVPFKEALAMIEAGTLQDSKTLIGLMLAEKYLKDR